MPSCRGCGERIYFGRNPVTNAVIPLDAEPLSGVNDARISEHPNTVVYSVDGIGEGSEVVAFNEGPARYAFNPLLQAEVSDRYVSHFVTCPNRDDYRKKKA